MLHKVKHVSISINKPKDEVYQYVSHPELFPEWLGFIQSIVKKSDNTWIAQTDMGALTFGMGPQNTFGIIDHHVTMPDGSGITNTLRVISNGDGSEVMFTLFRMPDKSPEEFEADAEAVKTDLLRLKEILEG